jgi:hypothetical protein
MKPLTDADITYIRGESSIIDCLLLSKCIASSVRRSLPIDCLIIFVSKIASYILKNLALLSDSSLLFGSASKNYTIIIGGNEDGVYSSDIRVGDMPGQLRRTIPPPSATS